MLLELEVSIAVETPGLDVLAVAKKKALADLRLELRTLATEFFKPSV